MSFGILLNYRNTAFHTNDLCFFQSTNVQYNVQAELTVPIKCVFFIELFCGEELYISLFKKIVVGN